MKKEFYLYVNGQKVKVSEEIYKVYWREREHEKYLEQVDRKNHLLFFSSLDHDGHYVDNIVDESVDVAKIVETQMMIESLRYAISKLNDEERDIIERLYFNDETLRSVAKLKSITHPALMKRRNKILEKLKKFIEEL
ncbi:RNA polymerase subunit sigma [Streptococcus sp. HMSC36C04]|jgi:DNA-directed RNA polymerase specialized sigma subunit|uniref:sigma-70 family RNA polymerase sigma factor n=1 Tax=Streptococcus sp. HMSC36C04 TaxID=1608868 RepID=UPI0008A92C53|nr:sigma-70 family RNA polymerase sigma factor [Streptococcus sp. HMSC36C04]MBF1183860.1 sigma-70 family RNA polymerase sigma factor [[Eubacterium] sulci]MDU3490379.1 sigma-70 family RNA polymerase sigma factor [Clostridiales bacterium]HEN2744798.1 sigma-70 family RNA polymerase sigma factor [Streptococcus agalactiae]HER7687214.1 sigma-70 family RNA polymerase sigma factor [Streptococcus pyogenes]OHS92440.1 RNA polymerase subunit sigma [Streptococcus sp. HMSC36C04]